MSVFLLEAGQAVAQSGKEYLVGSMTWCGQDRWCQPPSLLTSRVLRFLLLLIYLVISYRVFLFENIDNTGNKSKRATSQRRRNAIKSNSQNRSCDLFGYKLLPTRLRA